MGGGLERQRENEWKLADEEKKGRGRKSTFTAAFIYTQVFTTLA